MSTKRRGLGRGLDALLSVPATAVHADESTTVVHELPVDRLGRGRYQPRQNMHADTLEELAGSIRAQGVLQPVVVRPIGGGERYEIIAGERRWRAAQLAGLSTIPAIVRNVPDEAALAISLIENIQRENLNPLEEARALARLVQEFELTHAEAAGAVGRSRAAVSNYLRLLELDEPVRALVEAGKLEMGHARALLALPRDRQFAAAEEIARRGLSVRAAESLVRQLLSGKQRKAAPVRRDPDVQRLESDLGERLGARVRIESQASGRGRLVIAFNSHDELEGILDHLK